MRRIIVSINVTPDGFCSHESSVADEELLRFVNMLARNSDQILFGRVTYELFESFWPAVLKEQSHGGEMLEFANLIDQVEKVVFTRSTLERPWHNTRTIHVIDEEHILALKNEPGRDILMLGSPSIVDELTSLKLIDEYYIAIQPILAGKGKRLFEKVRLEEDYVMEYIKTIPFSSGANLIHYKTTRTA